jgi:hypothetical protein
MLTVGQLVDHLTTLDRNLPVGVIDVDRSPRSQRVSLELHALIDVDTVHDPHTGTPQAVWLTAPSVDTGSGPMLEHARPHTVVLPRDPCGCLIAVTRVTRRNVNLDAVACPHHQPSDVTIRSAGQTNTAPEHPLIPTTAKYQQRSLAWAFLPGVIRVEIANHGADRSGLPSVEINPEAHQTTQDGIRRHCGSAEGRGARTLRVLSFGCSSVQRFGLPLITTELLGS